MNEQEHEYWARELLKTLVNRVVTFNGGDKYITYGVLAKQIGYPEPHIGNLFGKNIGKTLGVMGHLLDNVVVDGMKPPLIQSMVVSSTNKLSSDGLKEFNSTYPFLSNEKKKDFAYMEYQKIFDFGNRWTEVLKTLKIDNPIENMNQRNGRGLYNPYGGEGSPEHRALRDYIAENPQTIDLDSGMKGIVEFPLKSGDSVDVVFETKNIVIAVEVKSERSGNDDMERGLFQCIKYRAVLKAEQSLEKEQKDIKAILVLASRLSPENKKKANLLGITVYENIKYI